MGYVIEINTKIIKIEEIINKKHTKISLKCPFNDYEIISISNITVVEKTAEINYIHKYKLIINEKTLRYSY